MQLARFSCPVVLLPCLKIQPATASSATAGLNIVKSLLLNRVLLPFCPRLRRLILERSQALGVHIIDTRNCFYLYQVDSSRWHTQIIGPRIPASWLHDIDDDSRDEVNDDNLEPWWEPDLCRSTSDDEPHDGYRQIAIFGVMMGDTNAVTVLEMAHRRQLINAGVLRTDSLLLPERPLPQRAEF